MHYSTLLRQCNTQNKTDVTHKCKQLWECIINNKNVERTMMTLTREKK